MLVLQESMTSSLGVLSQLGEVPLRDMGDTSLHTDMLVMNRKLQNTSDDVILNMQENMISKKTVSIMKLLANLLHVLHFAKPSLLGDTSLKMVELTMSNGLVPSSPFAIGCYGEVLVAAGNVAEGCRLGMYHE